MGAPEAAQPVGHGRCEVICAPPASFPRETYPQIALLAPNPCCFWHAGALITAGVLIGGLVAFKQGRKDLSQQMMRARIVAQGATVAIMLGSSGARSPRCCLGVSQGSGRLSPPSALPRPAAAGPDLN